MASADEARQLYEDLDAHSDIAGAYMFVNAEDESRLRVRDRLTRVAAECRERSVEHDNKGSRLVFDAPSPWHAIIHLIVENQTWLTGQYSSGQQMALVYRGQGNAEWPIISSLYRRGIDVEEETAALRAFTDLIGRFYDGQVFTNYAGTPSLTDLSDSALIPELLHVATAQHYGLRTALLDFTVEPAVAVWFACQSASTTNERVAVVYAIPSDFAFAAGASVVIPHPYIRRLYRQRGLFIEPFRPDRDRLRRLCIEVRFPPDPSFSLRRRTRPLDLLNNASDADGDAWWLNQVGISRTLAARGQIDKLLAIPRTAAGRMMVAEMTGQEEPYPRWLMMDNRQRIVRESTMDLLQLLLCLTTAMEGSEPHVCHVAVSLLVTDNAFALEAMLPLLQQYIAGLPSGLPLRVAGQLIIGVLASALSR